MVEPTLLRLFLVVYTNALGGYVMFGLVTSERSAFGFCVDGLGACVHCIYG